MKAWLQKFIERILMHTWLAELINTNLLLTAKTHCERVKGMPPGTSLSDVEFKVYSQWGEDGIIQYLIHQIPIENKVFVEFGVQNYTESNTRFLLVNDNWQGVVIDGDANNINFIKKDPIYWRYGLTAVHQFITTENINQIIDKAGIQGDIGILSIDIDGNDYWVWEAIEVVNPRIVICEYNSILGNSQAVTIPYDPAFSRFNAHYSGLYFGVSLAALCQLATKKGYVFVGSNSAGVNAFFVRKDCAGTLPVQTVQTGWRDSKVREARDQTGNLSFISGEDRVRLIEEMPFVEVESGTVASLRNLLA